MLLKIISLFLVAVLSAVFSSMKSAFKSEPQAADPIGSETPPKTQEEKGDFFPHFCKTEAFYRSCAINLVVGAVSAALLSSALSANNSLPCLILGNLVWGPIVSHMLAEDDTRITWGRELAKVGVYSLLSLVLFVATVVVATLTDAH